MYLFINLYLKQQQNNNNKTKTLKEAEDGQEKH